MNACRKDFKIKGIISAKGYNSFTSNALFSNI